MVFSGCAPESSQSLRNHPLKSQTETFLPEIAKFIGWYFEYHHSNYFTVVRINDQRTEIIS